LEERENVEHDDLFVANQPQQRRSELWLDLRQTAIAPREALQFLEKQLYTNNDNMIVDIADIPPRKVLSLVDKVLLSKELFGKVVARGDDVGLPLLYTMDDESILVEGNRQTNQSFPSGKIVTCRHTEILDPLNAIDITSTGQWLFVDKTDGSDEYEKILWLEKQVAGLVDFLSATTAAPVLSFQDSGLLLPSISNKSHSMKGGVAVSCRTRTAFVQLNSSLEQSLCSTLITRTTDSGILVTAEAPLGSDISPPTIRTALVLPFDLQMWEAARDIQDEEEVEHERESDW
jgi:hypothetical protein